MDKSDLDKMFHSYMSNGLQEQCPALPGPERDAWNVRRLYLACRELVEAIEQEKPPEKKSRAATAVCIATRVPGWAAYEDAFRTALQNMFWKAEGDREEGDEEWLPDFYETDCVEFHLKVTGVFRSDEDNSLREFSDEQEVNFVGRKKS